jgi:hypothetical protein
VYAIDRHGARHNDISFEEVQRITKERIQKGDVEPPLPPLSGQGDAIDKLAEAEKRLGYSGPGRAAQKARKKREQEIKQFKDEVDAVRSQIDELKAIVRDEQPPSAKQQRQSSQATPINLSCPMLAPSWQERWAELQALWLRRREERARVQQTTTSLKAVKSW